MWYHTCGIIHVPSLVQVSRFKFFDFLQHPGVSMVKTSQAVKASHNVDAKGKRMNYYLANKLNELLSCS